MYHYTECGLDNIHLKNGYELFKTEEGSAYSVHDLDALHKAIARGLVDQDAPLSGKEFRFFRVELDLSQKALGIILGKSEQQVANWEKGKTDVPILVDATIRQYYSETLNNESKLSDLLTKLSVLDKRLHELQFALEETGGNWAVSDVSECA